MKVSQNRIGHKMKQHCSSKSSLKTPSHHHRHHQQRYNTSNAISTSSPSANQISYISREVLADRILNAHLPTIIIDARDDDVIGGMIQGALFCPESSFTHRKMASLLKKAKEKRREHNSGITEHKTWVVFHCMETIERSVRCAKRFYDLVRDSGDSDIISVKLLTGGADGWIRSYWSDKRLVEGYDDKYWGFEEQQQIHDQDQKQLDLQQQQNQVQPRLLPAQLQLPYMNINFPKRKTCSI
jgi:hypothetical protein